MIVLPRSLVAVVERLTASLAVSMTEAEKADLKKKAAAVGLSMSAYARQRITGRAP